MWTITVENDGAFERSYEFEGTKQELTAHVKAEFGDVVCVVYEDSEMVWNADECIQVIAVEG